MKKVGKEDDSKGWQSRVRVLERKAPLCHSKSHVKEFVFSRDRDSP